jgi:hypothetical protein
METFDSPEKISADQTQAIAALLTSKDIKTAAQNAGCSETTLHRWLREDNAFKEALKQAQNDLIDAVIRRLSSVASEALDTLQAVMTDSKTQPGVKVRSAAIILEQLVKLRQMFDLEQRVIELEKILENERSGSNVSQFPYSRN